MAFKRPRKDQVIDRDKRVHITDDMIRRAAQKPRNMPPYFAHEPLDPKLYAGEMAMPVAAISDMGVLPSDIGADKSDDEHSADEDSELDLDDLLPNTTAVASTVKSHKTKPLPVDNGLVVGCRPLEGSGRKLCGLEDMDEDDKLIYYLKLAKWTERDIHNKLVSESRIDYHIKTIGTRFSRMRKYIMADNDERLKQGTIAWLEAEKKILPQAVAVATDQIEEERRALQQRKWKLVSDYIQKREPLAVYSGEACRQQYEMMQSEKGATANKSHKRFSDSKLAKLLSDRQQQVALIEHFKRAPRPQ